MVDSFHCDNTKLAVVAENNSYINEAKRLSERLNLSFISEDTNRLSELLLLSVGSQGLSLVGSSTFIRGDFERMIKRIKQPNLNRELLVKAAKLKTNGTIPIAIDATAGLGEDSLLLSAAGFHVRMYENDRIIAALLNDALNRAKKNSDLKDIISRMELIEDDSISAMLSQQNSPDIIYLDPMFPQRKKSALVKKKFQLLQMLESPCVKERELFCAAIEAHPRKVIVKRPFSGAYLDNRKPQYSLKGSSIRYDCYVNI